MSKQYQTQMTPEEVLKIVYEPIKNLKKLSRPDFKVGDKALFQPYPGSQLPKGFWLTEIIAINDVILGKQYQLHVIDHFDAMSNIPLGCLTRWPIYVDSGYDECLLSR
jgi:hypothetical protein